MLTPIDYEGTQKGFDFNVLDKIYSSIRVPLVISGGCGKLRHIEDSKEKFPDISVALASALHYQNIDISTIKKNI